MKQNCNGSAFLFYINMKNLIQIEYILYLLVVLTLILPYVNRYLNVPILVVTHRWVRWSAFAFLTAVVAQSFILYSRPVWIYLITGYALWFVLETCYNWIAIKALSASQVPIFPDFSINNERDDWPADKNLIKIKDWLNSEGFKRVSALKAELLEEHFVRISVYESSDQMTRIQVMFLPKKKDENTVCYTILSNCENGERLITDNQFLPFGGHYPKTWNLFRKPLIGSLKILLKVHQKRVLKLGNELQKFNTEPLRDIHNQQITLKKLNLETGFLVPQSEQEEYGQITSDGCYRLWKEMWLLAYFGRTNIS